MKRKWEGKRTERTGNRGGTQKASERETVERAAVKWCSRESREREDLGG
jgi:hypothetical protein